MAVAACAAPKDRSVTLACQLTFARPCVGRVLTWSGLGGERSLVINGCWALAVCCPYAGSWRGGRLWWWLRALVKSRLGLPVPFGEGWARSAASPPPGLRRPWRRRSRGAGG